MVAASLVHQASDTTQSETIDNEHSALVATELGIPLSDDNTTNNTRRRARGEESSPDQQHSMQFSTHQDQQVINEKETVIHIST